MNESKNPLASKTILYNAAKIGLGIVLLVVCNVVADYCGLAEHITSSIGVTQATATVAIGDGVIGIILRFITNKPVNV